MACVRCTADCGWITGHTYLTYGPLLNGATCILFGSTPTHPTPGRCWEIIEKYKARTVSVHVSSMELQHRHMS